MLLILYVLLSFFDSVEILNDSLLIIGKYNKYGLVNLQGMLLLPAKYSHEFENCSKGIVKFCTDDDNQKLYGLCDSSGKILQKLNILLFARITRHIQTLL